MMKFDALLRRGAGIPLLSSEENDAAGSTPQNGERLKALFAPVLPLAIWWLREIKGMLPWRLRRMLSERRILVWASQHELCIEDPAQSGGQEVCHPIRNAAAADGNYPRTSPLRRCDLVLDSSLVLQRELEMPVDAESGLRRVLAFSMDRYTPFNESDVLFDYTVNRRDGVTRKLFLTLHVTPKESVNNVLRHLAGMGIEARTMDVATADGGRAGINLIAPERRSTGPLSQRGNRWLMFSALILLLIAVALPFVQRQQIAARLQSEVEQLNSQLRQAETDRMELDARVERMRIIHSASNAAPAMMDVLLELTRLMPDDAWAGQVSIKSGRVRLTGEAGAASELLTLLSNSAIFSDPRFEAPLTQNPRTGRERFVISLAIKGQADAA